jgi:ABC-type multidrug transport system permease subunit
LCQKSEPASGLDSSTALSIIKLLRDLATFQKKTILLTIHMPRPNILNLFDKIILLCKGRVVWFGKFEEAVRHFESPEEVGGLGYRFPVNENPINLMMDVMAGNNEEVEEGNGDKNTGGGGGGNNGRAKDLTKLSIKLEEAFKNSRYYAEMHKKGLNEVVIMESFKKTKMEDKTLQIMSPFTNDKSTFANSTLHEIVTLTYRATLDTVRNTSYILGKIIVTLILILLLGSTFWDQDTSPGAIQNRVGVLFLHSVHSFLSCLPAGTQVFPLRRDIIRRERKSRTYRSTSAFFSFAIVELLLALVQNSIYALAIYFMVGLQHTTPHQPLVFWLTTLLLGFCGIATGMLLGGSVMDIQTALSVVPFINVISTLYAGNIANLASLPSSVRWLKYVTPVHYAYATFVRNEFVGLKIEEGDCKGADGWSVNPYSGESSSGGCVGGRDGEAILRFLGLDELSTGANLGVIAGMMVGLFVLGAWSVGRVTSPRFYFNSKRGETVGGRVHR